MGRRTLTGVASMAVDDLNPSGASASSGDAGMGRWQGRAYLTRRRLQAHRYLTQSCKPTFPLHIVVDAPSIQRSEAEHLVRTTQHALDDLNEFSAHHLRLTLGTSLVSAPTGGIPTEEQDSDERNKLEVETPALSVKLVPGDGTLPVRTALRPHSAALEVYYGANQIPSTLSSSSVLATTIAKKLQELFSEEQASIAYILTSKSGSGSTNPLGQAQNVPGASFVSREQRAGLARVLSPELAAKLAQRTTRSFRYAPTYHITISLFTPTAVPSAWNIQDAIEEYLDPLLQSFSISNFTVNTQVQLYAAFSPSVQQPELDAENQVWTLRNEDLSGFINAAEWPLGPSIGDGPTLNFILYVPEERLSPLVVKGSRASSWLIPQWGGVTILNPKGGVAPTALTQEDIQPALLTFSHQLLSLLGAPNSPPTLPLQLQSLTRIQAASLLLSASSTMGSLARLTSSQPSIPIPGNVALGVDTVLSHLHDSCADLRDGRFGRALEHARIAETEAERAFFEKSMVGQVYFPDEHKVAVYLPLLGPIGVPLLMSLLKEVKRFTSR